MIPWISYSYAALVLATMSWFGPSITNAANVDFAITGPDLNLGDPVYQQVICQHTFANSFGQPYSTTINAPSTKDFSHVLLTMETTANGTQFDRLAKIFVNGAEIWRTSTSEPAGDEIYFAYTKDVSYYSSLFKIDNVPFTVDLGNLVNDVYTGAFNVVITAKYYASSSSNTASSTSNSVVDSYFKRAAPDTVKPLIPADKSLNSGFSWSIPQQSPSLNLDPLPRNTTRAVVDIFASGNANEEFWYMNFLGDSDSPTDTPARVVTLNIDDDPVGAVLPFPVIYTGGFAPGLWIPVVGVNAYDVPSYRIDVTPYLPKLWNGAKITFGIDNGLGGTCNNEWLVSANLLTWQTEGISGNGQIIKGIAHHDNNTFNNPSGNGTVDLMSVARDLSTRAILNFTSSDNSVSETAFFTSSQSFSYSNAKNQYSVGSDKYYRIAQISSGYNSFKVTNKGVDLSKYSNGQEGDSNSHDSGAIVTDPNSDSDLITISEKSYIYPLAMNYYPSSGNGVYQTDINRGYGFDDGYLTIWTKQNGTAFTSQNSGSSVVTSNVRSDQYYAQTLVELSGANTAYDQYIATSGHQVVQNTYGSGNVESLSAFGTSDPITTLLSAAARLARNNKGDTEGITTAIINVFNAVLPPVNKVSSSSSSKRSVVPQEPRPTTYTRISSFINQIKNRLYVSSLIADNQQVEFQDTPTQSLFEKRDQIVTPAMASKVAEFQVGWKSTVDTSGDTPICWTCKTECCSTCDCGDNDFMFTLQIPGRTVSKRGVKGVFLDAKTPEDAEILKRQKSATTDTVVAPGRNPFFGNSKSKRSDDQVVAPGRNPFFKAGSLKDKRDDYAAGFGDSSKWTEANLLSSVKFWADGSQLFGSSSLCTTCGGGYYGGLSYSHAGNKDCKWGKACKGSS